MVLVQSGTRAIRAKAAAVAFARVNPTGCTNQLSANRPRSFNPERCSSFWGKWENMTQLSTIQLNQRFCYSANTPGVVLTSLPFLFVGVVSRLRARRSAVRADLVRNKNIWFKTPTKRGGYNLGSLFLIILFMKAIIVWLTFDFWSIFKFQSSENIFSTTSDFGLFFKC